MIDESHGARPLEGRRSTRRPCLRRKSRYAFRVSLAARRTAVSDRLPRFLQRQSTVDPKAALSREAFCCRCCRRQCNSRRHRRELRVNGRPATSRTALVRKRFEPGSATLSLNISGTGSLIAESAGSGGGRTDRRPGRRRTNRRPRCRPGGGSGRRSTRLIRWKIRWKILGGFALVLAAGRSDIDAPCGRSAALADFLLLACTVPQVSRAVKPASLGPLAHPARSPERRNVPTRSGTQAEPRLRRGV